ncbi:hypothetical protein IT418_04375 [bacterium]|nr:hypothetical protein [bacterium]
MKAQKVYIDKTKTQLFTDNLVAGIGWGIGTIIGAALLFGVLGFIVSRVQTIPLVGEVIYNIILEVQRLQGS